MTALPDPVPAGLPAAIEEGPDALTRLVAAWLLSVESPRTRRAYRSDLGQWAAWLAEHDVALFAARRAHVDAWTETLARAGAAKSTIARKLSALSSWYAYAIAEGRVYGVDVDADPTVRARRPRLSREHSETTSLSADQGRAFIAACDADGPRTSAIGRLMLEVGCRSSDVTGALIEDLEEDRGHRTVTVTRKGGRRQRLAMPAGVAHAVDQLVGDRTSGPIIITRTGRPMAPSEVYRTVQRIGRTIGVEIGPHTLRRTCATLALDAGAALRDVQDLLGHADPRTTRLYDKSRENLDRSASYKVAALLGV